MQNAQGEHGTQAPRSKLVCQLPSSSVGRSLSFNHEITTNLNNYYSNKLSRDGARHLSVLLRMNTPLSQLNISNNCIEDEGLVHISQALATKNTNLER